MKTFRIWRDGSGSQILCLMVASFTLCAPPAVAQIVAPPAVSGQPYYQILEESLVQLGPQFSLDPGSNLPPGFTFSTGVTTDSVWVYAALISTGSPPAPVGSYSVIINGTNSLGTSSEIWILKVTSPTSLQITTTSLPNATSGQPYSTTLAASGGSGTGYTWSLSSGSLPPGFTLSPAGVLSSTGSPVAANSYVFTVKVTDSAGNIATQPLTLAIIGQCGPLTINPPYGALPNATSGQPYGPITFTASGDIGATGYNVSLYTPPPPYGNTGLPAGFTFNNNTLSSTGSPVAAAGSYEFWLETTPIGVNCISYVGNYFFEVVAPSVILTRVSGDGQTGDVSVSFPNVSPQLPSPLVVRTTDSNGNPAAGVQVSFAITGQPQGATNTSLTTSSTTTAADGTASTTLTLGTVAGQYQVTASCANCVPASVIFTETASCPAANVAVAVGAATGLPEPNEQYITATLKPGGTLMHYATLCDFDYFNWQQKVTISPCPSPFRANPSSVAPQNICPDGVSLTANPLYPYSDPPEGGYTSNNIGQDTYPFYSYRSAVTTPGSTCTVNRTPCSPFP